MQTSSKTNKLIDDLNKITWYDEANYGDLLKGQQITNDMYSSTFANQYTTQWYTGLLNTAPATTTTLTTGTSYTSGTTYNPYAPYGGQQYPTNTYPTTTWTGLPQQQPFHIKISDKGEIRTSKLSFSENLIGDNAVKQVCIFLDDTSKFKLGENLEDIHCLQTQNVGKPAYLFSLSGCRVIGIETEQLSPGVIFVSLTGSGNNKVTISYIDKSTNLKLEEWYKLAG
jgi:hypothetical protein